MALNTVIFEIYIKIVDCNKEYNHFLKKYEIPLNTKIIDIRNLILLDLNEDNKFNYLDLYNITERVYKDFGKLFFDKGLVPSIIDNYILEQLTDEGRTFLFLAEPIFKEIEVKSPNNSPTNGILKKIIKDEQKKISNGFYYDEDDFPPLVSSPKKTKSKK